MTTIHPLIILFLGQFIIGPVIIYFYFKFPSKYHFELLDIEKFLKEQPKIFKTYHTQALESSFKHVGVGKLIMNNIEGYSSLYYSDEKKIVASIEIAKVVSKKSQNIPAKIQIEFSQIYSNGSILTITNGKSISITSKIAYEDKFRFSQKYDFNKLLFITNKFIKKYKFNLIPQNLIAGREFQLVEDFMKKELQHNIKMGWVSPKSRAEKHPLTIKGAIFMTWKQCFPVNSILYMLELRKSMTALKNITNNS
ncbi:hypothetical protein JXR93_02495 [bacterium]|nr:hypothetical protein [bacterium]